MVDPCPGGFGATEMNPQNYSGFGEFGKKVNATHNAAFYYLHRNTGVVREHVSRRGSGGE